MSKIWGGGGRDTPPREEEKKPVRLIERAGDDPADYRDSRAYAAFDLQDHAERLDIRPAKGLAHCPAYSSLLDIVYDYENHDTFALIFMFMVVKAQGRNLEQLVHSIRFGNCDCIREFSAKQHDKPGQGEPIIERLEIISQMEKD